MSDNPIDDAVPPLLLDAALRLAPSEEVRGTFGKMYSAVLVDGGTDKDLSVQLLGAMLDGLRYGNWPKEDKT